MHYITVYCDAYYEEKVAAVVPETCFGVAYSEAMLALCFSTLLVKYLMKRLEWLTLG